MKSLLRSPISLIALLLTLPATAQRADTARVATADTSARPAAVTPPARTVHQGAATKAVLFPFPPYVTQTGVGANGADVSELYTSVGYNWYGLGFQATAPNLIADDFVVGAGQSWNVNTVKWIAYQTGAPTSGTITSMTLNLWNSDPTGQLPGGHSTAGGNQFVGQSWTGVYRVLENGLGNISRALIEVTCGGGWMPALSAGTYFLEASATGSLTSGPWTPPLTVAGQTPPTGATYYSVQSVAGGQFAQVFDSGYPAGTINEPIDFVWQLEGSGSGSVASFCTSKPSSIAGCVPSLSGSAASVSKTGGPGSYTITAAPVPGGNGKPSILIYSKVGLLSSPPSTQFGFLCLNQFLRAGAFPQQPGGTLGTCSGAYNFDFGAMIASLNANPGDILYVQAWYRDPTNPGTANFTEGIGPVAVTP